MVQDRLGPMACAVAVAVWLSGPAGAADPAPIAFEAGGFEFLGDDADHAVIGAGVFNVIPNNDDEKVINDNVSASGRLEYRIGRKLWSFGPTIGILANTDGGVLGYGAIYTDVRRGNWHFVPMFGFGGYRRGQSKDLGGVPVFHMGLEVAYRFDGGMRLGLQMTHTSNAWTQSINPGVENLMATFTLPLD